MLYQRYFLRMNQSNTTHILSLLLALMLSLAAVHIILIPMESTSQFHKTLQRNRYNDTINGNGSNISAIASLNRSGNITNVAPLINSQQQNFLRLNYNYSTGNETGKLTFSLAHTHTHRNIFVVFDEFLGQWQFRWQIVAKRY